VLADDVHRRATLAQLAAQVGEVRIAGHQADGVRAVVEQGLQRIEGQHDVRGLLTPRGSRDHGASVNTLSLKPVLPMPTQERWMRLKFSVARDTDFSA
jgi:hypothetical protein